MNEIHNPFHELWGIELLVTREIGQQRPSDLWVREFLTEGDVIIISNVVRMLRGPPTISKASKVNIVSCTTSSTLSSAASSSTSGTPSSSVVPFA